MLVRNYDGDFKVSHVVPNHCVYSPSLQPSQSHRLLHFTATAQLSILSSFARIATALDHLRKFTSAIFAKALQIATTDPTPSHFVAWDRKQIRSLEAFADAIDSLVRTFDRWCATQEEEISLALGGIGPDRVVTLLSLEKHIRDRFSDSFFVVLDILQETIRVELIVFIALFADLATVAVA